MAKKSWGDNLNNNYVTSCEYNGRTKRKLYYNKKKTRTKKPRALKLKTEKNNLYYLNKKYYGKLSKKRENCYKNKKVASQQRNTRERKKRVIYNAKAF